MAGLNDFIAKAKSDKDLQGKLAAAGGDADAIAKIAAGAGFTVTAAEIKAEIAKNAPKKGELNEKDLSSVAGGVVCVVSHYTKGRCEGLTSW